MIFRRGERVAVADTCVRFHPKVTLLGVVLGAVVIAGAWSSAAFAEFPEKPMRVIVPNPAGSNSDLIMRLLAPRLAEVLGQNIVIDNRPGGNGMIANNVVRSSVPDGYTVLFGTATNLAGDASVTNREFDPVREFSAIGLIATLPYVLVVNNLLPVKSVRELVEFAKARPNKLTYAYTPGGSLYAGFLFARLAGLQSTAVPYNSGPQAMTAIVSGEVNFMFYPFQALSTQINANRMRAIATTAAVRPSWMAAVPTMVESGFPDLDFGTFVGLYVPAKTNKNVIGIASKAMLQVLKDSALQAKYAEVGTVLTLLSPTESDKYTEAAVRKYQELEKLSGGRPN